MREINYCDNGPWYATYGGYSIAQMFPGLTCAAPAFVVFDSATWVDPLPHVLIKIGFVPRIVNGTRVPVGGWNVDGTIPAGDLGWEAAVAKFNHTPTKVLLDMPIDWLLKWGSLLAAAKGLNDLAEKGGFGPDGKPLPDFQPQTPAVGFTMTLAELEAALAMMDETTKLQSQQMALEWQAAFTEVEMAEAVELMEAYAAGMSQMSTIVVFDAVVPSSSGSSLTLPVASLSPSALLLGALGIFVVAVVLLLRRPRLA